MTTYTITLKADFVDPERTDAMMSAVRDTARDLLSTAMLLKDKRDPSMAIETNDMFERVEIKLDDEVRGE